MGPDEMPVELARVLAEHSPRIVMTAPVLLPYPASPTGWVLIVADSPTEDICAR